MKYFYMFLALLALYPAYSYGRIMLVVWQDRNPKITQSDAVLGTGPGLRYIAAGDSTAFGEGASAVDKTYSRLLAQHLAEDRTVHYRNIGVRGATTQSLIDDQLQQIIEYKPDVVTISIGANDRTHLNYNSTILANLTAILDRLQEGTSAKIYLTDIPNFDGATLLPPPYIWLLESRTAKLNPKIKALENDRVKIVNVHDFGWDQFPDLAVTYAADQFHPNDVGYRNWADAFLSRMR